MLNFSWDRLLYAVPAIIIALTFHEYAHARVAYAFGDTTAKNAGRLTLNPFKHLDIIGTLLLIFAGFGWAKPVPINPFYFGDHRKRKLIWVSVAGPLTNLIEALVGAGILSLLLHLVYAGTISIVGAGVGYSIFMYFINLLQYFVSINIVLAVFNIIPIPPLDGSKVLAGLLPGDKTNIIFFLDRYGFVILLVLALTNILDKIISVPAGWLIDFVYTIVGL